MKVIVIDPATRTIEEITDFKGDLQDYYRVMGCDLIDRYPYDDEHDLILDDEGLFKNPTAGFSVLTIGGMFVGKAIIARVDRKRGEWVDHNLDIDDVRKNIQFIYSKEDEEQVDDENPSSQD